MKIAEKYQWYPVCTNPRAEKKAFVSLQQNGIEAYLPLQRQLKQWSDRKKWVEEPLLIKSYLFVRISVSEQTNVLMTPGISRFIYFSGKIASIPERQIENIKLLLAKESDMELSTHEFTKGESVMVIAGPLQGLRGELVTVQSQRKLLVRIEHIGQSLLVQVPAAFIEPIGSSPALSERERT